MKFRTVDLLQRVRTWMQAAAIQAEAKRLAVFPDTSCKPGCSHCCSRYVVISLAEALILRQSLVASGHWQRVLRKARELEELSTSVDPMTWFKMNIGCPILDGTGRCSAYDVRPPACSTHYSASSPSACDPWSLEPGRYSPLDVEEVFDEFSSNLAKELGGRLTGMRLPMAKALSVADAIAERSGVTVDEVIQMARVV